MHIQSKGLFKINSEKYSSLNIKASFFPQLSANMLSLGSLVDLGFFVVLTPENCFVLKKFKISSEKVLTGVRSSRDKLWYFYFSNNGDCHPPSRKKRILANAAGNIDLGRSSRSELVLDGECSDLSLKSLKRNSSMKTSSDHTYLKAVDLNQELSDNEEDDEIPLLDHNYFKKTSI